MENIIYCYLDQINLLLKKTSDIGNQYHWGIAFEKKDEGVYHLFTEMPEIIPSGIPITAIFSTSSMVIDSSSNINNVCKELQNKGKENKNKEALILLFLDISKNGKALVTGYIDNKDSTFSKATIKYIPGKEQLYSRAKGILEHSLLEKSRVSIIGLGSFGSYIAVELAKAGVGHFDLIDFDRLELANIARHQCGINDLGRLKTNAISDLIKLKNPYAKINKLNIDINKEFEQFKTKVSETDLLLCLTDNNESRNRINEYSLKNGKITIFGRAITRAEAGDVFILRGDKPNEYPCLTCLVGMGLFKYKEEEKSQFKNVRERTPAYVSNEDVEATIQVGLSSDINPINNMIVKLSLLELSKNKQSGLDSLREDLIANYYLWVNRRENKYKNWEPMKFFANKPSILRWYGAKLKKDPICPTCNSEAYINSLNL